MVTELGLIHEKYKCYGRHTHGTVNEQKLDKNKRNRGRKLTNQLNPSPQHDYREKRELSTEHGASEE